MGIACQLELGRYALPICDVIDAYEDRSFQEELTRLNSRVMDLHWHGNSLSWLEMITELRLHGRLVSNTTTLTYKRGTPKHIHRLTGTKEIHVQETKDITMVSINEVLMTSNVLITNIPVIGDVTCTSTIRFCGDSHSTTIFITLDASARSNFALGTPVLYTVKQGWQETNRAIDNALLNLVKYYQNPCILALIDDWKPSPVTKTTRNNVMPDSSLSKFDHAVQGHQTYLIRAVLYCYILFRILQLAEGSLLSTFRACL